MTQNIDQAATPEDDGIVGAAPEQEGVEVVEDADTVLEEAVNEVEDTTDTAAQEDDEGADQDAAVDDATEDDPEAPSDVAGQDEGGIADDALPVEAEEDVESDDANQAAP